MNVRVVLSSALAFGFLIFQVPSASPCSLAPRPDGPRLEGAIGPHPLLISADPAAVLRGPNEQSINLGVVNGPPELAGAKDALGAPLFFFEIGHPLADGDYEFGNVSFTVSSSASESPPSLGSRGELELYLSEENADNECGDVSALIVDLKDVPATELTNARFLVSFERPNGTSFRRLVSLADRFEATVRLRFYSAFAETGHLRDTPLCVKVSPVSSSGVLGQSLDLGCVDPTDEADPRVFRAEGAGCSATRGGAGLSSLWLLLGLSLFRRRREARR